MSQHNSLKSFTIAVKNQLESKYDAEVNMDEIILDKTNESQAGLQRDDLYRFMMVVPNQENWESSDETNPSKLYVYLPTEIDQIADRPGVPVHEIEPVEVSQVIDLVDEHAPEYEGEFEYED